jgi:hypothetical protein
MFYNFIEHQDIYARKIYSMYALHMRGMNREQSIQYLSHTFEFDRTESEIALNMLPKPYRPKLSLLHRIACMTTGFAEKFLPFT